MSSGLIYRSIWQELLAKHSKNFDRNFTEDDLRRIHLKWKRLGSEA